MADSPAATTVPHDVTLEEQVLGGLLLGGQASLVDAATGYGTRFAELFHKPRHVALARAYVGLLGNGNGAAEQYTPVTAAVWLDRNGTPAPADGWLAAALDVQTAHVGLAGSAMTALDRLDELASQRQLLTASLEVAEAVRSKRDPAPALEALGQVADRRQRAGRSNWNVIDLVGVAAGEVERATPAWLTRTDGQAYLYPGRSHFVTSLPKAGKSWLGIRAMADVVTAGGTAIYIDPEDTPHTLVDRMVGIGVPTDYIGEGITYLQPAGPLGPGERGMLLALAADRNADLVVFDGLAEVLAASGVDEDRNAEVAKWWAATIRPLERLGCTVLIADHTRKPPEDRRRGGKGAKPADDDWARGAGHKRAAVTGAHYHLVSRRAATYTQSGELTMYVAVDRPGAIPRQASGHTATMHVVVDVDGSKSPTPGTVTAVTLSPPAARPPASESPDGDGEVYVSLQAARALSAVLCRAHEPLRTTVLFTAARSEKGLGKKWSTPTLEAALRHLVAGEFVAGSEAAGWEALRRYAPNDDGQTEVF